jgi:hypothetical protein
VQVFSEKLPKIHKIIKERIDIDFSNFVRSLDGPESKFPPIFLIAMKRRNLHLKLLFDSFLVELRREIEDFRQAIRTIRIRDEEKLRRILQPGFDEAKLMKGMSSGFKRPFPLHQ